MNLILQAIKSMFRGLTKKVDKNTEQIDKNTVQIDKHTANIKGLQDSVETAQSTADNAQATAEDANYIYNVTVGTEVSHNMVFVQGTMNLVKGRIYTLIPNANSTGSGASKIKVNGKQYFLYPGISAPGEKNLSGSGGVTPNTVFRSGIPLLVYYSGTAFYAITRLPNDYVKLTQATYDDYVPNYILAQDTITETKRCKYMRVKSSTAGSTKLFDIQVDDNGTITAVEVTE